MDLEEKATVIEDMVAIEKKTLFYFLGSVSIVDPFRHEAWAERFSYGSIYYASDSFEGCEKASIAGDISGALRKDIEARFVIGPTTEREFWSRGQQRMNI